MKAYLYKYRSVICRIGKCKYSVARFQIWLTSVPVEESLATEHCSELLRDALEEFLYGCGVSNEGG